MKVLLLDVDSTWGNPVLMKLSRYHKNCGRDVSLIRLKKEWRRRSGSPVNLEINSPMKKFDKAYISCIFKWNAVRARSISIMLQTMGIEVELGGSGVSFDKVLPDKIERLMPDYDLYDLDYSMGFLTRGCIRKCPWCIVPKKEGHMKRGSELKEFLDPRHDKLMLLDNNLLAHPEHKDFLMELLDRRVQVCFTQGLDIRLVDKENAKLLKHIRYRDTEFKTPRLYFSWDLLQIEDDVMKGIELLKQTGIHPNRQFFYILSGFNVKSCDYTWDYFLQNEWYRFETLKKMGVLPFVMIYNNRTDIPLLRSFARWVNWMFMAKKKDLGLLQSFTTYLKHDHPSTWKSLGLSYTDLQSTHLWGVDLE